MKITIGTIVEAYGETWYVESVNIRKNETAIYIVNTNDSDDPMVVQPDEIDKVFTNHASHQVTVELHENLSISE